MKTVYIKIGLLIILLSGLTGCGDEFFNRPPQDQITEGNFFQTEEDLEMVTGPLYNLLWFDFNDKAKMEIGDVRAGNMITSDGERQQFLLFSTTSANMRLNELWRSLYLVITNSNIAINNIEHRASDDIPQMVKDHRIAEARFMRGAAYAYLAQLWGAVPIITSTARLIETPNVPRNRREDVIQFAINDFEYAKDHLVLVDQPGRVTEWSAKGMLARLHLTRAHFESQGGNLVQEDLDIARGYAEDIIHNSGLALMDSFEELFFRDNNNNPESLFALQWVYEGNTWGRQNSTQAYYAPEARITGAGDGWGGGTGASSWLLELFGGPESDDLRRKSTFMLNGDHYPEILQNEGGYTYELESSAIKKYVIGTREDNDGKVGNMTTDINTYMLRLAEVYLIHAQATLGNNSSTSDSEALASFNAVRERAGLDAVTEITYTDIFEEKWKELAFEGQNWYELIRLFNWKPNEAKAIIDHQERNTSFNYVQGSNPEFEPPASPIGGVNDSDFTLQYPEADVSSNPILMDEPVAYDFDE